VIHIPSLTEKNKLRFAPPAVNKVSSLREPGQPGRQEKKEG
jgi:hypothetical protein